MCSSQNASKNRDDVACRLLDGILNMVVEHIIGSRCIVGWDIRTNLNQMILTKHNMTDVTVSIIRLYLNYLFQFEK